MAGDEHQRLGERFFRQSLLPPVCENARRCCSNGRRHGTAIRHAPNPSALVVGNIKRTVGSDGEARRAVRRPTRLLHCVGEAIGAPANSILRQFFLEALIVAMISGGAGLLIAFGLCALVDLLPMPDFFAGLLPTWQTGTLALAVLGTIAILSALYPARRAAAIDHIEALRHEAGG